MSVRIVDVREITKPISSPIRNAYIDFTKMTTSLVAVVTDVMRDGKRVVGYGFNSNGRYGQGGLIRERFAPRLLEADPKSLLDAAGDNLDPDKVWATMMSNEKPGGHGERSVAVGTIDMAVWEAVLKEIGKDAQLAVDANGRFDLETAISYAKMLRQYPLFWYEEAGDPLDFQLQAALAEFYPGAMATGENLFSHQDARNLVRYGGMRPDRDFLQFDCALSYGLCEYQRTLAAVEAAGWSRMRCIPHGGHQMSLAIAAGLGLGGNENYPDLFQPFGGFPDAVRVESGHIVMPELPGIGFEGKAELYKAMRVLAE